MLWICVPVGKAHTSGQIKMALLTKHTIINMMASFLATWLLLCYNKLTAYKNEIYTFSTLNLTNKKTLKYFPLLLAKQV